MAKRRMFSLDIVDTDAFLDMPASTQNLYFHLGMRADDDGFISSPRKITALVNCSADDYKLLIAKGFIVPFDSGICVIRDWQINNYLRPDRYTPTLHTGEKQQYQTMLLSTGMTLGIPTVATGKDRIGKVSKVHSKRSLTAKRKRKPFVPPTVDEIRAYISEKNLNIDAEAFFTYFDAGDWHDSRGQEVRSWKQKLLTWDKGGLGVRQTATVEQPDIKGIVHY